MRNKKPISQMSKIKVSLKLRLILSFFLMVTVLHAQNIISGTITDSKTLETIIEATISVKGTRTQNTKMVA